MAGGGVLQGPPAMSSFLMPAAGGGGYQHLQPDPKFPPSEEYSQGDYIPNPAGDFFQAHHHLGHPQHHHLHQYGYGHHHQPASTPYGTPLPLTGYGSYSYYPQQVQHPPAGEIPAGNIEPGSGSLGTPGGLPGLTELGLRLERRIEEAAPAGQQLHELRLRLEDSASLDGRSELDEDRLMMDGSPDLEDDDDDECSESGDRVIYPWMKKIHVAGVGEIDNFYIISLHIINEKIAFTLNSYFSIVSWNRSKKSLTISIYSFRLNLIYGLVKFTF